MSSRTKTTADLMSLLSKSFDDRLVYAFLAIKRPKDNDKEESKSKLVYDKDYDLGLAKAIRAGNKIKALHNGKVRIYVSINKRDLRKAAKDVLERIVTHLDTPDQLINIPKWFDSAMMSPSARATSKFLIDIDTRDPEIIDVVKSRLSMKDIIVHGEYLSYKGVHIVTDGFDSKILALIPNVEVKKDALRYVTILD